MLDEFNWLEEIKGQRVKNVLSAAKPAGRLLPRRWPAARQANDPRGRPVRNNRTAVYPTMADSGALQPQVSGWGLYIQAIVIYEAVNCRSHARTEGRSE